LIGLPKDIQAFSQKDKVKLLVISDSHGSQNIIKFILNQKAKGCDALCFCGDGLTDIFSLYSTNPELFPPVLFSVRGNNDISTYSVQINDKYESVFVEDCETFFAAGHKVFLTHGHKSNIYVDLNTLNKQASTIQAELALFGHIHIALNVSENNISMINPGSCSRPRGGQPGLFATIEIEKDNKQFKTEFFEIRNNGVVKYMPNELWFY